jgi:hypothetical protein
MISISVIDVVGEPLEGVVVASAVGVDCATDDLLHPLHEFLVSSSLVETPLKGFFGIPVKALHARTVRHHLHSLHDLPLVLPDEFEREEEEQLEVQEDVRVDALHQLQVVLGELEGSLFEGHVARRTAEDEAKINVNYVSVAVHQDVVVVPVLYLEQILHH